MKTYKNIWEELCSVGNIEQAYFLARKRKTQKINIQKFDKHWQLNLICLRKELLAKTYTPRQLKTFILRDPKTRLICVSDFRDRVVHHAIVNILKPIFEPRFIYDSYASRKGKGTIAALKRFDQFLRKITKNGKKCFSSAGSVQGFAFKADIKQYFESVDHNVLLDIIGRYVVDKNVLWLVKLILGNYNSSILGKGIPLGNWTSQFFANIYLNELD